MILDQDKLFYFFLQTIYKVCRKVTRGGKTKLEIKINVLFRFH